MMSNKIPKTYIEQHGCHDCYFCFCVSDFDDSPRRFCRRKAPKRPSCGSVSMNEPFFSKGPDRREIGSKRIDAWYKWAENREVKARGICLHWIKIKKEIQKNDS